MDNDIFGTPRAFIVAAGSYFGLPDEQLMQGSGIETSQGAFEVVLRVALTPDDLAGIAVRMKVLHDAQDMAEPVQAPIVVANEQRLRDEYNSMDKRSKSEFGSFARYKAWRLGGGAEVVDKVDPPAHVYLSPAEATPQQKAMSIGRDEKGNYVIAVEDLTPEQQRAADVLWAHEAISKERVAVARARAASDAAMNAPADQLRAEYVQRTMDAHARLNGADGKPTSNADDFGGLPG